MRGGNVPENSFPVSSCDSPAKVLSSIGFSLCGFDFRWRRTAHRLKPVLLWAFADEARLDAGNEFTKTFSPRIHLRRGLAAVAFGGIGPVPASEEEFDEHQRRPDGYGRIGDVKRGPAIGSEADLQEIGYAAVNQAIEGIACSAAQDQRESGLRQSSARPPGHQ